MQPSCGLAVVLPGGRRIEVHPDFDTNTFERLVRLTFDVRDLETATSMQ